MVWPTRRRGCWPSWRWQPAWFPWLPLCTCPTWLGARCPQTSTSPASISSRPRHVFPWLFSWIYLFVAGRCNRCGSWCSFLYFISALSLKRPRFLFPPPACSAVWWWLQNTAGVHANILLLDCDKVDSNSPPADRSTFGAKTRCCN